MEKLSGQISKDRALGREEQRPRVAVVYTHFPHYRRAVFEELRRSSQYAYAFFYDRSGVDPTIVSAGGAAADVPIRTVSIGGLMLQPAFLRYCVGHQFKAYIFLGNAYILSTWLFALILRLWGRKVLFWTHGWTRRDSGPKNFLRCSFYRLADALLLYGNRAKSVGMSKAFRTERMHVVYNSLDYPAQEEARRRGSGLTPEIEGRYFLCVSRLVAELELQTAIEAIGKLRDDSVADVALVVVGDGPERDRLAAYAASCRAPVRFLGAIYDEDRLAGLFMNCLAVVSPGKVGLLAIHAMAYGAPVITHDDFDRQMPEVEAIRPPATGRFFRRGDVDGLCEAMGHYLTKPASAADRQEAINVVEESYTPQAQRALIERALDELLGKGAPT